MKNGKLIVIDGMDGSGKTEQTRLLIERMAREGIAVEQISFPRYGKKSCGPVEEYLSGKWGSPEAVGPYRASVFYAVDRWAAFREGDLSPLELGVHMIANRYVASNKGHQGSKIADPAERLAFFQWNDELEHGVFGIPRPDLNVILHVPAEVSLKLLAKRGRPPDAHENLEHLKAAEATYLEIARTLQGFALIECATPDGKDILPLEDIHEMVWSAVRPLLRA